MFDYGFVLHVDVVLALLGTFGALEGLALLVFHGAGRHRFLFGENHVGRLGYDGAACFACVARIAFLLAAGVGLIDVYHMSVTVKTIV